MNTEVDPYQRPDAPLADAPLAGELQARPVGFWKRVLASFVDTIWLMLIVFPILYMVYGAEYFSSTELSQGPIDALVQYVFPAVAVILFWIYKSATPGKMIIGAIIVDAETGGKVSTGRLILRYVGYLIGSIPLCLGLLWVAWDRRKQGWHDKMAGTMVVYK